MGFFVQDPSLIVTYVLNKTALVLAVLRWVLSWALSFRNRTIFPLSDYEENSSGSCSSSSSPVSSQAIRDSLVLSTFDDVKERLPWVSDTCAVCLGQLGHTDEVRELRNCCHVFHRECIDRWVDHHEDNHKTCPLCRAPLLASSQAMNWPSNEPSWAVERLLYLFGDDLLPS
ncbi:hypothetical protein SLA2020_007790 [Shorea laevis]